MNLLNSSGNWLLIFIELVQTIVTEFTIFNLQTHLQQNLTASSQ